MQYYIGIDGGGTKTEFVLTDANGTVISRALKEGTNPNDKGIEGAYSVLRNGIKELLQGKQIPSQSVYIFAGISGAGVGENAKRLQEKLQTEFPRVELQSDTMNALEICLNGADGLAVICGTGISSIISVEDKTKTVGGYGYLFEDGGSGYAYGRDAVKAALRYEDGVGEYTLLYEYLTKSLGRGVRASLGEMLAKGKFFIASHCPLVFEGYRNGDEVCKAIVEQNVRHTLSLIKEALGIYPKANPRIGFTGGVSKIPEFQAFMKENLKDYEVYFCEEQPVIGAVRRAMKGERKC